MKILTPEPRYNLTMIPETPDDFKQVLAELCNDEFYGCWFEVDGHDVSYGLFPVKGGFEIGEGVERKDYWHKWYDSANSLLHECRHIKGRPLVDLLSQMRFHPSCDCA